MKKNVVIVGAGLTGLTMALSMAQITDNITIIEKSSLTTADHDSRTTALNHKSIQHYTKLGLWKQLAPNTGMINKIGIVEQDSKYHATFTSHDVGSDYMGGVISNRQLKQILLEACHNNSNITIVDSTSFYDYEADTITVQDDKGVFSAMKTDLLLACDGKNSVIRKCLGIDVLQHDYASTSITGLIKHSEPHYNIAYEVFYPDQPLALLPMADAYVSSFVWTMPTTNAKHFLTLNVDEQQQQVYDAFGDVLGSFTLKSKLASYPIGLQYAKSLHQSNAFLVGDSAHIIHPIAGQGFNLTIRDIIYISDCLSHDLPLGLTAASSYKLANYAKRRKPDHISMIAATHAVNSLFAINGDLASKLRGVGLSMFDLSGIIKRQTILHAMGGMA
jgi:2-octaprenyl-6-methoxyphenol hydroxylase